MYILRPLHIINVHHNNHNSNQQVVAFMHNISQQSPVGLRPCVNERMCSSNKIYREIAVVIRASSFRHYNRRAFARISIFFLKQNYHDVGNLKKKNSHSDRAHRSGNNRAVEAVRDRGATTGRAYAYIWQDPRLYRYECEHS
jgi:hypothetical protein